MEYEEPPAWAIPSGYRHAFVAIHRWCRQQVDRTTIAEASSLPFEVRRGTPVGDLLVVHATPRGCYDMACSPAASIEDLSEAYGEASASLIAFGHYHENFVHHTPVGILVNVACVGLRPDRRPLAGWTELTALASGWTVRQHHCAFDPAEEIRVATERGLPRWQPDDTSVASTT